MRASAEYPDRCAAPWCDRPVRRRPGPGRPALYCSPACRPGATARARLTVEVDHEPTAEDGRPLGRVWVVRLRRGTREVVIASELGRPSADHLAGQIAQLLSSRRKTEGGAME